MLVSSLGSKVSSHVILSNDPWFYHQIGSSYIFISMDRSKAEEKKAHLGHRNPLGTQRFLDALIG